MSKKFVLEIRPFGNSCNRKCAHCYQNKTIPHSDKLDLGNLLSFLPSFKNYFISNGFTDLHVVFHGGEPLIDGGTWVLTTIDHFRRYFDGGLEFLCHTHGYHNESLLSRLSDESVHLGVSLIPPSRPDAKLIPPAIPVAAQKGILNSIQIVLLPETFSSRDTFISLLDILPKNTNIKFIPCLSTETNGVCISPVNYGKSLSKIASWLEGLDYWKDFFFEPISWIKYFEFTKYQFRGCRFTNSCNFKNREIVTFAIDHDGNIYSCNRFAGVRRFKLTNIDKSNWLNDMQVELTKLRELLDSRACLDCTIYEDSLCGGYGGCPFHSLLCIGMDGIDKYCQGEKNTYFYFSQIKKRVNNYDVINLF